MKYLIPIIIISAVAFSICYLFFLKEKEQTTEIPILINLDIKHPNHETMEYFLNNYEETIRPTKVDWRKWEKEDLIKQRYAFITEESQTSLYLVFCKTQADATTIGEANFSPKTDSQNPYFILGINNTNLMETL